MGKAPEIFSAPRKTRKSRKSQPESEPEPEQKQETEINSDSDSESRTGMSEMSDILFDNEEPSAEDLMNMSKELMLEDSDSDTKHEVPDIFNDPETDGEGEN
ncbi:MAG: hypothetical protein IJG34_08420, partial [Synergistaceae bacterium]|nr:hypothetical protein [Synergistaceae bacterium]MBQ3449900.1 hypothetical protein [Synergistaceae bacterium]